MSESPNSVHAPAPSPTSRRGVLRAAARQLSEARGINVGARLRALREERNLSMRALAERSELAVNTLSLIENGKTSPSVNTLQQLAYTLNVPITAFFEQPETIDPVMYRPAIERPRTPFEYGFIEDLGSAQTQCPFEPFLVTLAPGTTSGQTAITHTGHEFVLGIEGTIIYTVRQQEYLIEPGDSLLFEAYLPHTWRNSTRYTARMLIMFCHGGTQTRPERAHFLVQSPHTIHTTKES